MRFTVKKYEDFCFKVMIGAMIVGLLYGCSGPPQDKEDKEAGTGFRSGVGAYSTVRIDGCQYISGWKCMAHKGNCDNPIHLGVGK